MSEVSSVDSDSSLSPNADNLAKSNDNPVPTDRDWFLSHFVNMANDFGYNYGITLNVGGTIISGQLIGGREYFDLFADEIAASFPDTNVANSERDSYKTHGRNFPDRTDESDEEADARPVRRPFYIHLKDARFFANGQPPVPGNRGVLWRGRIEAVDGFSLGTLSAET